MKSLNDTCKAWVYVTLISPLLSHNYGRLKFESDVTSRNMDRKIDNNKFVAIFTWIIKEIKIKPIFYLK